MSAAATQLQSALYGRVTFFNESGEIKTVDCRDERSYERELDAGARWIELFPKRRIDVQGERYR